MWWLLLFSHKKNNDAQNDELLPNYILLPPIEWSLSKNSCTVKDKITNLLVTTFISFKGSTFICLAQWYFHSWKYLWKSYFDISKTCAISLFIVPLDSNWHTFSGTFILEKNYKSQGTMSTKYRDRWNWESHAWPWNPWSGLAIVSCMILTGPSLWT